MANKESLLKLLDFITEISSKPENQWFKLKLLANVREASSENESIKEIHEYCIQAIIKAQAEQFYKNFRLTEIKEKLINDFVRMEQFKRRDNFEDFSLAMFQQVELIVNTLCSEDPTFCQFIKQNRNMESHKAKNRDNGKYEPQKLYQLLIDTYKLPPEIAKIFDKEIIQWEFKHKFKAVLFFFYFDKKIFNLYDFTAISKVANELQQARNLNHRGGFQHERQIETIAKVIDEQYRYYYRFLGFLEDFTSKINERIKVRSEVPL